MDLTFNIILLAQDARSYCDAYEILNEKMRHNLKLSSPAIVCLAFSVELHIKLLLKTHGMTVRGHDIGKLLLKLPKDEISWISNHADFHPTMQGKGFFANIATASDLFTRTRYYYEDVSTHISNTGFCITLAKVIRKRIVERVPYLRDDLGELSE